MLGPLQWVDSIFGSPRINCLFSIVAVTAPASASFSLALKPVASAAPVTSIAAITARYGAWRTLLCPCTLKILLMFALIIMHSSQTVFTKYFAHYILLSAAPVMSYAQLEALINKWSSELEDQERHFLQQATQVNAWDRMLVENGEKVNSFY